MTADEINKLAAKARCAEQLVAELERLGTSIYQINEDTAGFPRPPAPPEWHGITITYEGQKAPPRPPPSPERKAWDDAYRIAFRNRLQRINDVKARYREVAI